MSRARYRVLLCLLLSLWSAIAAARTLSVAGPEPARNQAFGEALQAASGGAWRVLPSGGEITVTLGGDSFIAALSKAGHGPVLGVAVSRPLAQRRVTGECRCSAIWRGVPLALQVRLVRAMVPAARRVGVLLGPHSAWEPPPPSAGGIGLQAVWVNDPRRLGQQLRSRLPEWDALLLPDDETLFDAGAAKLILLTGYRQRVPVFGPDAGYVRAGSVASAYTSAGDMARATVEWLNAWQAKGAPPPAGFAGHYSLTVNEHVARAYDLIVQDREGLQRTLESTP